MGADELLAKVHLLQTDNSSGASEILRETIALLGGIAVSTSAKLKSRVRTAQQVAQIVAASQPEMASLQVLAADMLNLRDERDSSGTQSLFEFLDAFQKRIDEEKVRIADFGSKLIEDGMRIITISRSGTVLAIFQRAKETSKRFRVLLGEGRPMLEGVRMAENLSGLGIPVTVVVDGALHLMTESSDLLIVGADRVCGQVLYNKIGTFPLLMSAAGSGVPRYAAFDNTKIVEFEPIFSKLHPASEVSVLWEFIGTEVQGASRSEEASETRHMLSMERRASSAEANSEGEESCKNLFRDKRSRRFRSSLNVANPYFEPVPLERFTGLITDRGILKPQES